MRRPHARLPRLVLALALAFVILATARRAFAAVEVDDAFGSRLLGRDLELAYDRSGDVDFERVRAGALTFTKSTTEVPNFGYRDGAEWARFSLRDLRGSGAETLVLENGYAPADLIEVYFVVGEGRGGERGRTGTDDRVVSLRAGDHVPHAAWPVRTRLATFRVPPATREIYVREVSGGSHQLHLTLRSADNWHDHATLETGVLMAYYGALAAMLIYNLLVWVAVGLPIYGGYVGFLFAFGAVSLQLNGSLYALVFSPWSWFNDHVVVWGVGGVGVFGVQFMLALLDLGPVRVVFARVARGISLAFLAVGLLAFVTPYAVSLRLAVAAFLVWTLIVLAGGVAAAHRGERAGRWFLLAWSAFLFGTAALILKNNGLLPSNAITSNAAQVGSAIEFLLLSFALADRIKQLQATATANAELAAANARAAHVAVERALEEEKRLGEEREQFVANTSHELRTPLNGMMGLVQAVMHREAARLSPASRQSLDGVVRSGQRLAALVNDLLDLASGQRGAIVLHRAPISLKLHAALVFELLEATLERKSLTLALELPPGLPPLDADPQRLQQVLFNLVGNAIKFTESGTITVGAQAAGGLVTVRVTDTGPGIAEAAQARIFEAFQQADGGIARRFGGTGLGLAITKQLVEAHGGSIGVTSTFGFGSTFWFTLPASAEAPRDDRALASVVRDKAQALDEQLLAAGALGHGADRTAAPTAPNGAATETRAARGDSLPLRVLVADDEAVNRQVLAELLALGGHEVSLATNGREALAAVHTQRPDVVLLDVMMPELSGYAALTELRASHDALELPVLLLTARAQEKDLVEGFSRGATDYIIKPFAAAEVLARVEHQARLREAMRRAAVLRQEGEELRVTLAEAEEQLLHAERLASIGAATAGVAHDLGNPLHHVTTTFHLIAKRAGGIEQNPAAAKASILELAQLGETSGRAAGAIAEALRKASRSDDGVVEPVRFDDVVDDALVILGHKLRGVRVERERSEGAALMGRRSEVLQVAMNLIGNAADAVSAGEARALKIAVIKATSHVALEVHDSGPGVPEALRARILQPFFTTKPTGEGTGLGLSTVATIVKRWGGELQVGGSDVLGGALFRVELEGLR